MGVARVRDPEKRRIAAQNREMTAVMKQELRLWRAARRRQIPQWKQKLEQMVPGKARRGLEQAFGRGFSLIFSKGVGVIEKTYPKQDLQSDYAIRDYAFRLKGRRRELKQIRRGAGRLNLRNLTATTMEGVALGLLGIGMPDVAVFLGVLFRGIYETALSYGFAYESPAEKLLILKMMEAALSSGDDWVRSNEQVDQMLVREMADITPAELEEQTRRTAAAFSVELLLLKFIQGIPVAGVLGGAGNTVYYHRIMQYVQLKYRKRYLLKSSDAIKE